MRRLSLVIGLLIQAVFATGIHIQGVVQNGAGTSLGNVVVELEDGQAVRPRMNALTDSTGRFAFDSGDVIGVHGSASRPTGRMVISLDHGGTVRFEAFEMQGRLLATRDLAVPSGVFGVDGLEAMVNNGHGRLFVVRASQDEQKLSAILVPRIDPREVRTGLRIRSASYGFQARTHADEPSSIQLRKAGYLSKTVSLGSLEQDLGVLVLTADPLEKKIDSVMALMTIDDKIGQMAQGVIGTGSKDLGTLRLGSLLSGGGDSLPDYASLQKVALGTPRKIPMIYGIDAVHGTAKVKNATIFPHHIGMGASRDSALARRMGEVTAQEMIASGTDWAFAPCIAVPQDDRWGRTYEGFGETPELAAMMGAAEIRGMQGTSTPWSVIACAKHFVADGGTSWNTGTKGTTLDEGDAQITEAELRSIHLPGYRAAVRAGVGTVMASYSLVNGVRNHGNKGLLTDVLKTELGFDGFVVSDWLAIQQLDTTDYASDLKTAINAGVDMGMEPNFHARFITTLKALVASKDVPQSRIDDAVRRILRVKFRSGRMDNPYLPTFVTSPIGTADHRAIAREAVRKSLVVLKNDIVGTHAPLPIAASAKIAVHGTHADDAGLQCGGWTLGWQGKAGTVPGATTILAGLKAVLKSAQVVSQATQVSNAAVAVFVLGEQPYAENYGDMTETNFSDFVPAVTTKSLMAAYRSAGVPVVTVFVTGRPRPIPTLLANSDAVVVAWLPGSEGEGVADVLSGDFAPTGKLPVSWPASGDQEPINVGDGQAAAYPYGFGLTW